MNEKLTLPARCTMLDENEMVYVDGGDAMTSLIGKIFVTYVAVQVLVNVAPLAINYIYQKVSDWVLSYTPMPIDPDASVDPSIN